MGAELTNQSQNIVDIISYMNSLEPRGYKILGGYTLFVESEPDSMHPVRYSSKMRAKS